MDTAKKIYDMAYKRSLYLVRLAYGLTNHRSRCTRCDWAEKFKHFMHWKQSHQIERIDSKDAIIVLRDNSYLKDDDFSAKYLAELYRSAVVLLMSAFDSYYHAKISTYVVKVARRGGTKHLENLKTELGKVIPLIVNSRKGWNCIRPIVDEHLSYRSLQRPDKIANAMQYLGIQNFWDKIVRKLEGELHDKKEVLKQLNSIAKRRDQIVHEGDTTRRGKYAVKERKISHKEVYKWCLFINAIVAASDKIINQHLSQKTG